MRKKNLSYEKYLWIGLFLGSTIFFLAVPAFADDGNYRPLIKYGGLVSAVLGIIGIGAAGYFSGKNYDSYTGWGRHTHARSHP